MHFAGLDTLLWMGFCTQKPNDSLPALPESIEQARQEWLYARHFYNQVTDADLIEHAIYQIKASETKYNYLLKRAKRENLICSANRFEIE